MNKPSAKTSVSFPVTVAFVSETGAIQIIRRTDPQFKTEIVPGPNGKRSHEELYASLRDALTAAGVECIPTISESRWN